MVVRVHLRQPAHSVTREEEMGKTVLIVDDARVMRQACMMALKSAGFKVIEAERVRALALEALLLCFPKMA